MDEINTSTICGPITNILHAYRNSRLKYSKALTMHIILTPDSTDHIVWFMVTTNRGTEYRSDKLSAALAYYNVL